MIKILFVCHGNICRSVAAEYIAKDLDKEGKHSFISRATSFEEIGIGKDGFKNDTEKANYITELIANWLSGDYTQMKPKTNAKVQ